MMVSFKQAVISVSVAALLQACVAYPKQVHDKDIKRCDLVSKQYSLAVKRVDRDINISGSNDLFSILLVSGVVITASAVVSGSIVILGNTVHFLEKQGRCDDSYLNEKVLSFVIPLLDAGGERVEQGDMFETSR